MFHTAEIKGGLLRVTLNYNVKSYGVDNLFPICNTFVTSQVDVIPNEMNVVLATEYRDNEILFKRVGSSYLGEGDI